MTVRDLIKRLTQLGVDDPGILDFPVVVESEFGYEYQEFGGLSFCVAEPQIIVLNKGKNVFLK